MRLQGVYVSDSEIQRLVDYWRLASASVKSSTPLPEGAPVDSLPVGVPLKQTPLWDDMASMEEPGDPLLQFPGPERCDDEIVDRFGSHPDQIEPSHPVSLGLGGP